jgi:hypothetical protein
MLSSDWFLTQPTTLSLTPFDTSAIAVNAPSKLFTPEMNHWNLGLFGDFKFTASPVQIHLFVITAYIAIVSPFGALFFTVLKRSLKADQLGKTLINGGVIDRADCLLVTGLFIFIYVGFIVYKQEDAVSVMKEMILKLSPESQRELYDRLLQMHNSATV